MAPARRRRWSASRAAASRSRHHLGAGLDPARDAYQLQDGSACSAGRRSSRSASRCGRQYICGRPCTARSSRRHRLLEQLGLGDKRNAWFMTLSAGRSKGCSSCSRSSTIPTWCFRRADPRPGPTIAANDLGNGARHPRPRQDGAADHAPDGGSRAPVRPRGDRGAGTCHRSDTPARLVARHCRSVPSCSRPTTRRPQLTLSRPGRPSPSRVRAVSSRSATRRRRSLRRSSIACRRHRIRVTEFRTIIPTLEDVFLKLTGHSIRD